MILYLKDPKIFTKKLLDAINTFSNISGYKINLQKSIAFLYSKNKQIKKEYMKTFSFAIPFKKIKYLGINLTKAVMIFNIIFVVCLSWNLHISSFY
jgi:hypothetical protein